MGHLFFFVLNGIRNGKLNNVFYYNNMKGVMIDAKQSMSVL